MKLARALVVLIGAWQREVVAQALAEEATWQDTGDALGISRASAYRQSSD